MLVDCFISRELIKQVAFYTKFPVRDISRDHQAIIKNKHFLSNLSGGREGSQKEYAVYAIDNGGGGY